MAYGDLKVRNLIWNTGSGDNTVVLSTLATQSYVTTNFAPKANPTFTGTVTVPTAPASDVSTKAASTAFVDAYYATKAAPAFTGSATGVDLTLSGNLVVNGTTTTINTQTLDVEDINITLGKVSTPSDTTANNGGITLKGSTDKTFNWLNATDSWTSSEHIEIASGKNLKVDGTTLFADGTNNRVGILTTSPAEPLSVSGNVLVGDGSNGKHIRFSRSGLSAELIIGVDGYGNAVNNEATIQSGAGRPLVLMTNGAERLRIESSGATRLKNEYLRFQAANHAVSDFSQKVGLKWTYETDIEIAKIEISRPSWSGGPSDMVFHTCNTSGTVSERLRIGNSGQLGIGGANYGSSGQVLKSQGASAAPQWADATSAAMGYDLWCVDARFPSSGHYREWNSSQAWGSAQTFTNDGGSGANSGGPGPATMSISRCTTSQNPLFAKVGTGMSMSAGVWTFPNTGEWRVTFSPQSYERNSSHNSGHTLYLWTTSNNGTAWHNAQRSYNASFKDQYEVVNYQFLIARVNITDTSNQKIYFSMGGGDGRTQVYGRNDRVESFFMFEQIS